MEATIRKIQPEVLWNHFADLNAVPRPSKKEARIVAFVKKFGQKHGLDVTLDALQNVRIRKPASPGMEGCKTVVLQAHLDMVHQKNNDTLFDFDTQGIQMEIKEDWVHAKGTTLGADNGIGVAAILSVLSSKEMKHPPIEALFTVDEETGMTGALGLQPDFLSGDILLNLDTEDDDEIAIGCAGGIDVTAKGTYLEFDTPKDTTASLLSVKGLRGGHSGMDIHKGFGNANKILARMLLRAHEGFNASLAQLEGGNLRNAIPRESRAVLVLEKNSQEAFDDDFKQTVRSLKKEFAKTEPKLEITLTPTDLPDKVMDLAAQKKTIQALCAAHNGVYAMSTSLPELVETSNNVAKIYAKDGCVEIACLTRSFSESGKMTLANALRTVFESADLTVCLDGSYPGWLPNPNSEVLNISKALYEKMFESPPKVMACHAGLECGILGTHYPKMEMISFGPNIRGAHSPEERVSIRSTQKFWKFLTEILKNIPEK